MPAAASLQVRKGCGTMIQTSNPRHRTGIHDLLDVAARHHRIELCVALDDTTRSKYANSSLQEAWVVGLLHSGVCPDHLGRDRLGCLERAARPSIWPMPVGSGKPTKEALLWKNLERIRQAIETNELVPALRFDLPGKRYKPRVDLATLLDVRPFHDWSVHVELPVIGPWPTRGDVIDRGGVIRHYPHDTGLLRVQEEVAWRCQKLADELGDWPPNDTVADLVREYGVKSTPAKNMATVLRPNHLPLGRPPGSTSRPKRQR